ncbi:hypothetical protein ABH931_003626 [Streptacidiphilus sp. MAP12-33]|uniref:hypothetical protein n=1 Tax=Streptacidiphilus sp. MAP12-33 TaxID=3156266 RepID=UPI003515C1FB
MRIRSVVAATAAATGALLLTVGVGTASAASNGYFDTASVGGCSADRYLELYQGGPHQGTYYVVTNGGSSNVECTFWMVQNGAAVGGGWSRTNPLYDGPTDQDQLCVSAFNLTTNRNQSTCDTLY